MLGGFPREKTHEISQNFSTRIFPQVFKGGPGIKQWEMWWDAWSQYSVVRGQYITNSNFMHYFFREIPRQIYYTFILFDPPKRGPI